MNSPGFYLAVAVIALLIALWMVFQVVGALFKLLFFAAIVAVGIAAFRAWRSASAR